MFYCLSFDSKQVYHSYVPPSPFMGMSIYLNTSLHPIPS